MSWRGSNEIKKELVLYNQLIVRFLLKCNSGPNRLPCKKWNEVSNGLLIGIIDQSVDKVNQNL